MAQPKANSLKRRQGNIGKRRIPAEWTPTPGSPPCPAYLRGEALEEWKRVTFLLDSANVLTQFDRPALADYCTCWVRVCEAEKDISERGLFVEGTRKAKVMNPSLRIAREYRKGLMRYCELFGFAIGPRERMDIKVPQKPADPMDEVMFGGN